MKNFTFINKNFLSGLTLIMMIFTDFRSFGKDLKSVEKNPILPQVATSPTIQGVIPVAMSPNFGSYIVPLDGTFNMAFFNTDSQANPPGNRTDEGSTSIIALPFTFCFYGTNYNACYIEANGNVSFGATFTPDHFTGFPVGGFPLLAPFLADVDNRPGIPAGGLVWLKTTAHSFIVIWDSVGYNFFHTDKLNSFELIITDGTDPVIGLGNNVAFSYRTMQWTTSDRWGGVNGFGGSPATVGINDGNGVLYSLIGSFDHAGIDYNGPGGSPSGVGYLQNQNFIFNACPSNPTITCIPTLSEWSLIILGFLLVVTGTFFIIRKDA